METPLFDDRRSHLLTWKALALSNDKNKRTFGTQGERKKHEEEWFLIEHEKRSVQSTD